MAKRLFNNSVRFDPQTTLFVTDLDGTLLTKDAILPIGAKELIRELDSKGVKLTYSTARTIRSAAFILEGLPFPAPISLMNGVLIRDMNAGKYVTGNLLQPNAVKAVLEAGGDPFIYTLTEEEELFTSYKRIANDHMAGFMRERKDKYSKPFRQLDDLNVLAKENQRIIYFCYLDSHENLDPVYKKISSIRDTAGNETVKCAFYPDRYRNDLWYLEVFAPTASKGTSIRTLKKLTGAETIVSFGDNGNDLPMFEESDYAFAVSNANDKVKAAASGITEPGLGVLDFIAKHIKL